MRFFLQALVGRIDVTPGRVSALGAAIGGLFALMVVNVFGVPDVHVSGLPITVSNVTTLTVGGVVLVLAQVVGALVAWGRASHRGAGQR